MTDKQKRALGIGGIALAGLVLWRQMHSTRRAAQVTNSTATGSITPYTPQSPIVVPAGESIYDPNSQNLLTTPTPIDTTGGTPGTPGNQTAAAAAPSYNVNVTYPTTVRRVNSRRKPAKRTVKKR